MDNLQETLNDSIEYIKKCYDLDLTLVELVRLKLDFVIPAIQEYKKLENPNGESGFDPAVEAATGFLAKFYGIPAYDIEFVNSDFIRSSRKELKEYLKILQDRAHLI